MLFLPAGEGLFTGRLLWGEGVVLQLSFQMIWKIKLFLEEGY